MSTAGSLTLSRALRQLHDIGELQATRRGGSEETHHQMRVGPGPLGAAANPVQLDNVSWHDPETISTLHQSVSYRGFKRKARRGEGIESMTAPGTSRPLRSDAVNGRSSRQRKVHDLAIIGSHSRKQPFTPHLLLPPFDFRCQNYLTTSNEL